MSPAELAEQIGVLGKKAVDDFVGTARAFGDWLDGKETA